MNANFSIVHYCHDRLNDLQNQKKYLDNVNVPVKSKVRKRTASFRRYSIPRKRRKVVREKEASCRAIRRKIQFQSLHNTKLNYKRLKLNVWHSKRMVMRTMWKVRLPYKSSSGSESYYIKYAHKYGIVMDLSFYQLLELKSASYDMLKDFLLIFMHDSYRKDSTASNNLFLCGKEYTVDLYSCHDDNRLQNHQSLDINTPIKISLNDISNPINQAPTTCTSSSTTYVNLNSYRHYLGPCKMMIISYYNEITRMNEYKAWLWIHPSMYTTISASILFYLQNTCITTNHLASTSSDNTMQPLVKYADHITCTEINSHQICRFSCMGKKVYDILKQLLHVVGTTCTMNVSANNDNVSANNDNILQSDKKLRNKSNDSSQNTSLSVINRNYSIDRNTHSSGDISHSIQLTYEAYYHKVICNFYDTHKVWKSGYVLPLLIRDMRRLRFINYSTHLQDLLPTDDIYNDSLVYIDTNKKKDVNVTKKISKNTIKNQRKYENKLLKTYPWPSQSDASNHSSILSIYNLEQIDQLNNNFTPDHVINDYMHTSKMHLNQTLFGLTTSNTAYSTTLTNSTLLNQATSVTTVSSKNSLQNYDDNKCNIRNTLDTYMPHIPIGIINTTNRSVHDSYFELYKVRDQSEYTITKGSDLPSSSSGGSSSSDCITEQMSHKITDIGFDDDDDDVNDEKYVNHTNPRVKYYHSYIHHMKYLSSKYHTHSDLYMENIDSYDLICPASYGPSIWKAIQYSGLKGIGQVEYASIILNQGKLSFPRDYPDTESGKSYWYEYSMKELKVKNRLKPSRQQLSDISLSELCPQFGLVNTIFHYTPCQLRRKIKVNKSKVNKMNVQDSMNQEIVNKEQGLILDYRIHLIRDKKLFEPYQPFILSYDYSENTNKPKLNISLNTTLSTIPRALSPCTMVHVLIHFPGRGKAMTGAKIIIPSQQDYEKFLHYRSIRRMKTIANQHPVGDWIGVDLLYESYQKKLQQLTNMKESLISNCDTSSSSHTSYSLKDNLEIYTTQDRKIIGYVTSGVSKQGYTPHIPTIGLCDIHILSHIYQTFYMIQQEFARDICNDNNSISCDNEVNEDKYDIHMKMTHKDDIHKSKSDNANFYPKRVVTHMNNTSFQEKFIDDLNPRSRQSKNKKNSFNSIRYTLVLIHNPFSKWLRPAFVEYLFPHDS